MTSSAVAIERGIPRDAAGKAVPPSLTHKGALTWYLRDGSYLTLEADDQVTRTATEVYKDGTIGTLHIPVRDGPIIDRYYYRRADPAALQEAAKKLSEAQWLAPSGRC